jgi:hypothetical protein
LDDRLSEEARLTPRVRLESQPFEGAVPESFVSSVAQKGRKIRIVPNSESLVLRSDQQKENDKKME